MLSTFAENTIKAVNTKKNTPVHLLFNRKKVGQMFDFRINLGDPPKDLVEEWAQNYCICYPFWGQYKHFPKNSYCYVQSFAQ